jgi:hypothetical protein
LHAYEKAGLKLQPAKCQLFQQSIEYLGHMVSVEGIAPVPGYVQVVKDWPMPINRSEVRTFLGKTGYYRRFMENYAEVAGPLTDILAQEGTVDRAPIDQTSPRINSFEQLKSNLLQAPILEYPKSAGTHSLEGQSVDFQVRASKFHRYYTEGGKATQGTCTIRTFTRKDVTYNKSYEETTIKILLSKVRGTKLGDMIKFPSGLSAPHSGGVVRDALKGC